MITLEQLADLTVYYRETITEAHLDVMGHMNVRHYLGLFDEAAWYLFAEFGMDGPYYEANQAGAFALQQFIRYLAEVRLGETVAIRSRLLGRSARRLHFIHFMVNETTGKLAATLETLSSHADTAARRTSPFPAEIAEAIDTIIARHEQLGWEAPVCGVIRP